MAKRIQLRRGTTNQSNSFTGAVAEVTVDSDKKLLVVHDGMTQGGYPVGARANTDNSVSLINKNGKALAVIPNDGLFVNNLETATQNQALTAAQGKLLDEKKLDKAGGSVSGNLTVAGTLQTTGQMTTSGLLKADGDAVFAKQVVLEAGAKGALVGNADTATKLKAGSKINGIIFDGSQDIIVKDASKVPLNSNPTDQGAYMSWNTEVGLGRTDFINHRGNGSGGFAFWNKSPTDDNPNLVATIDPSGNYSGYAAGAPSIFRGEVRNDNDAHYARSNGHYLVAEYRIAGLYSYGIIIVVAQGSVINQTYYAHNGSVNGSIATRQSWDGGNNWSGWRSVDKPALGEEGQTWQNVAGQRSPNTYYLNSTGRTIYVYVAIHDTAGGGYGMRVGDVSFSSGYDLPAGCYWPFSFPVPPGVSYMVWWGGNNKNVLHHWWELR